MRNNSPKSDKLQLPEIPQMAPAMKNLVTRIAEHYAVDLSIVGAHLRLEQDGCMPLVIETVGRNQISVAHYYEQNGDLIADPEVVFYTGYKDWMPFQITQPIGGFQQAAILHDDGTAGVSFYPRPQAEIAAFCRMWARNLEAQGFGDAESRTFKTTSLN